MGCYNTLLAHCPQCERKVTVQTKLGDNNCRVIQPNEMYLDEKDNFIFECKEDCPLCGYQLNAHILNGKFIGFTEVEPTHIELLFGEFKRIDE